MKEQRIIPAFIRDVAIARLGVFLAGYNKGKAIKVTIQPYQHDRTVAQNSVLWGLAYPPIMEHIGLRGDQDKQELHRQFCGMYFGWRDDESFLARRPKRTTTTDEHGNRDVVSTVILNDMFEFIRQTASELFGIVIPDPDPDYRKRGTMVDNATSEGEKSE